MNNEKKLTELFGAIEQSEWEKAARDWKEQQPWKEYAQQIAIEVLELLEKSGMSQKSFAEKMKVSPQVVNKWLKGKENFTLETIAKMEFVLGEKLIQIAQHEEVPAYVEVILPSLEYCEGPKTKSEHLSFSTTQYFDLHLPYSLAEN